jgi:hypothetical protein
LRLTIEKRWSIYIDIEGFGDLYETEDQILLSLGDLMEGIYLIGTHYYCESPDRIFAHQTGDGFAVIGEFCTNTLEVPIAIAIALMRHVAARGLFAKATIAEGTFADIAGLYPASVLAARDENGRVPLGRGIMTLFSGMGSALIHAVALAKISPSGALLTLADETSSRLPDGCLFLKIFERKLISVDWIHSSFPLVSEIQSKSGLKTPTPAELRTCFSNYFRMPGLKEEWKANSNWFLSLALCCHETSE